MSIGQSSPRKPGLIAIFCGIITTLISLAIVWFLAGTNFNIIGWFWFFIVPAGAFIVGMGSGVGYYFGSKWTNSKIAGIFMWMVFLISVAAFVASHYITYWTFVDTSQFSFFDYIRFEAENMTFGKIGDDGEGAKPLGKIGYIFLGLQGLGFSLGALVPLFTLSDEAYCEKCRYYLKKQHTVFANSRSQQLDLKKKERPEKEGIIVDAINDVVGKIEGFIEGNAETSYEETMAGLGQFEPDRSKKALAVSQIDLLKCPACETHQVKVNLGNVTVNGAPNTSELVNLLKPDPMNLVE